MPHVAVSKYGKVLEAMWGVLDDNAPLNDWMDHDDRPGTPHRYRVFDGTNMPGGDVHARETPALIIDPVGGQSTPLEELSVEGGGFLNVMEGDWNLWIWGYLNSLDFDQISHYYDLTMTALYSGANKLFADATKGYLQGADQIIRTIRPVNSIPASMWVNPSDIEKGINKASMSFFHHSFVLEITTS